MRNSRFCQIFLIELSRRYQGTIFSLRGLSSIALQHRRKAVQQSSVVLVVEDELAIQGLVENVLSEAGFDAV